MGGKRSRKRKKSLSSESGSSDSDSDSDSGSESVSSASSSESDSGDDEKSGKKKKKSKEKELTRMPGNRLLLWLLSFLFNTYQVYMFLRSVFGSDLDDVKSFSFYRLFDTWHYDFYNLRVDDTCDFILKDLGLLNVLGYFAYCFTWLGLTVFSSVKMQKYKDGDSEFERKISRTTFIDEMISSINAKQLVIIGADLDTRAYNDELLNSKIDIIYEVGNKSLLRKKRKIIKSNELADLSHIIYVGADIEDDWSKNLDKNGFDPGRPTIFVCEDLIYYHDEQFAEDLLGVISDYMEQNSLSVLLFDYYDEVQMNVFGRIWNKRIVGFEVPGRKSGRKNVQKWLSKHSLYVHQHFRMENLGYGVVRASLLKPDHVDLSSASESESGSSSSSSSSDSDSD